MVQGSFERKPLDGPPAPGRKARQNRWLALAPNDPTSWGYALGVIQGWRNPMPKQSAIPEIGAQER